MEPTNFIPLFFVWLSKHQKDRIGTYIKIAEEFKKGLIILRQAHIYTQRIDWLVSGDDGEESFITRLAEDLKELNLEKETK